jgi:hypothetical protein
MASSLSWMLEITWLVDDDRTYIIIILLLVIAIHSSCFSASANEEVEIVVNILEGVMILQVAPSWLVALYVREFYYIVCM